MQLVRGARGDEHCDIKYDDGDVEEDVPLVLIRLAPPDADGHGDHDRDGDGENDSLLKRLFHGLTDEEIKALLKTPWTSPKEKREVLKTIALLPLKQKKAVCRLFLAEDSESRANRLEYVREFVRQQSELRRRERAARKIQKGLRTRRTSKQVATLQRPTLQSTRAPAPAPAATKNTATSSAEEATRRNAAAIVVQRNFRIAREYKKCSYKQSKDSALKIQRYYRSQGQRAAAAATGNKERVRASKKTPRKSEAELTADLLAAVRNRAGVEACEAIIMANADVHATGLGDDGVTLLYAAVEAAAAVALGDDSREGVAALTVVSMLLKFKASPNVCTAGGAAPLHVAASLGSDEVVKILLRDAEVDAGVVAGVAASVFKQQRRGSSAGTATVGAGGGAVTVGCDVNIKDSRTGQTPLAVAAKAQPHDSVVVRLLLDAGGIIDAHTPAFQRGDTVESRYQGGQGSEHYFPARVQTAFVLNTTQPLSHSTTQPLAGRSFVNVFTHSFIHSFIHMQ